MYIPKEKWDRTPWGHVGPDFSIAARWWLVPMVIEYDSLGLTPAPLHDMDVVTEEYS